MSESNYDVLYKEIAASVLLMPGDRVELFMHAAAALGNKLLKLGYDSDSVIERLVEFGACYTELRDNITEPPTDPDPDARPH